MDSLQPPSGQTALAGLPVARGRIVDFTGDVLGGLFRLHHQFGRIAALEDGAQRIVFLFDPVLNHQVLSDTQTYEARFFTIRGPKHSPQRRVTCGLLGMNGQQHRRNRRVVKETFGLRAIAGYQTTVAQLTDELLDSWRPGETIDLATEMTRYMLRVTSRLLFGLNDQQAAYRLGEQIADWVSLMHNIGAGALTPSDPFTERYEELLATGQSLENSVMAMMDRRRAERSPGQDVLSLLLRAHDEGGQLTEEELIGQACVLFAASHMTTAHSLLWTLLLLAQHPREMQRVYLEAMAAGGEQRDAPYLERAIKESMRVLPASAYSQRVTSCGVRLGPFDLPRGTPIVFTPLVTHRLANLYDQPERFLPDRWLTLARSPYEYLPFGAGSRMCIGGPLAMEILRTALPRIVTRYRLSVPPEASIDAEVHGTMLSPVGACRVEIHDADGRFQSRPLSGNLADLVDFPPPESLASAPRKPR